MLSVRELNSESIQNRSWVNERLGVHPRLRPDARPRQRGHDRGAAGAVHSRPAAGVDGRHQAGRAEHLLRRAVERLRPRPDAAGRVPLPARRRQRGRRPTRALAACRSAVLAAGVVRDPVRQHRHPVHEQADAREPDHLSPPDLRAGARARAVPDVRHRSLSGRQRRPDVLDPGRVHDDAELPVLDARRASGRGDQLHPELGEDRHRRVSRVDVLLSRRARTIRSR